jgi:hypothetical protein
LGKYKTVGCDYERESGQHRFKTTSATPASLQQLVQEVIVAVGRRLLVRCWAMLRDGNSWRAPGLLEAATAM